MKYNKQQGYMSLFCHSTMATVEYVCDLESLSFFCIQKPPGVETWSPVEK